MIIALDLDGTIYDEGIGLYPSARKVFSLLKDHRVYIITDRVETREHVSRRINHLIKPDYILTPVFISRTIVSKYKTFYAIANKEFISVLSQYSKFSEKAEVVFVGFTRKLTFKSLTCAFHNLINGADFYVTSLDKAYLSNNELVPGTGYIVASLEYISGKKPNVLGKPSPNYLNYIFKRESIKSKDVVVIGDNPETDGKIAKNKGVDYLHVDKHNILDKIKHYLKK